QKGFGNVLALQTIAAPMIVTDYFIDHGNRPGDGRAQHEIEIATGPYFSIKAADSAPPGPLKTKITRAAGVVSAQKRFECSLGIDHRMRLIMIDMIFEIVELR